MTWQLGTEDLEPNNMVLTRAICHPHLLHPNSVFACRTPATERTPSAEEREIMEAAMRHAAMLDPTAPASRWTLEKPWM